MQKRHFVEKPGYWVYDAATKTLKHQTLYPSHNLDHWIYAGSQGHVLIDNDKIIDFFPVDDVENFERNEMLCFHVSKEYIGFTDRFLYCVKCGAKL